MSSNVVPELGHHSIDTRRPVNKANLGSVKIGYIPKKSGEEETRQNDREASINVGALIRQRKKDLEVSSSRQEHQ